MPSYRVVLDVLGVHPGVTPANVLPRAEEILGASLLVEDRSVELVGGQPQIHLRFLVPATHTTQEDDEAERAVRTLTRELSSTAHLGTWQLRRGPGGHWRTIRTGTVGPDLEEHPVDF